MEEIAKDLISHRVVDQLSPHHDSQFSAFSTEVFDQVNRKHNRSRSPFTTLVDKTKRRVASTGAGQSNNWPKTWFGADAYNAKLVTPKYAIELFGLISATHMLPYQAPGDLCRGVCVKQPKKQGMFVCGKANTEDGLCSLKSDWYVERNLTDYDTTT